MDRILPVIREDKKIPTLYVDGQPFLAFAGEVHNSAAYDTEKLEAQIWKNMDSSHLNTLIVPIYWETLEPEEGTFDFTLADTLLEQAQRYGKKLILLWFGLWKNAESSYIPGWMKRDDETYFHAEKYGGEKLNTISPACGRAVEKDAAAFARLMAHLREEDHASSVIMVQVENEVGLLGTDRDYCAQAQALFSRKIPELMRCTAKGDTCEGREGSWTEAFGEDAAEAFSAWQFASALEKIASAGRKEYAIPCYTNVWLKQFPWYPGSYPSGGPVHDMLWLWKAAAPSLFTIAPDIYVSYVPRVMEEYGSPENPLLIPEVRKDAVTASYALYAFLHHHAIGYAPFGIEDLWTEDNKALPAEVMEALKLDPLSFHLAGTKEALSEVYRLVEELKPLYLKYRGTNRLQCYLKKTEGDQGCYLKFSFCDLEIEYFPAIEGKPAAAGAVFELEENKLLIAGMMSSIKFHSKAGKHRKIEFLKKELGTFQNGKWLCEQRQNGDEKIVTILSDKPCCYCIELFDY